MTRLRVRAVAAGLSGCAALTVPLAHAAHADVQSSRWAVTALTLNSPLNSNEVGFWQQILYSNNTCFGPIDGIYGTLTKNATKAWQTNLLHYTGGAVDGVVGVQTWDDTENLTYVAGGHTYHRFVNSGGDNYYYYGGSAYTPVFYWGGAGAVWKFQHDINATGGPDTAATTSRTMGSTSC